ncbi:MAG TPA: hypothetical protein VMU22_07620 [Rhizomicrobium sp.]|nr:hypothetical protein [Rhizomicrobium sp.]
MFSYSSPAPDLRESPPSARAPRAVPVLAEMPRAALQYCADIAVNHPQSVTADTLRGIARRIAAQIPCIVAVTSFDPNDGQSSFSTGLARVAAQQGLRTILLDGNLTQRVARPGLVATRTGWVDVLRGKARLSQSMAKDPRSPMLFMPAGQGDPRAAWTSGQLFAHLRRVSDLAVIDAAPVAPGGELPLLARLSDALIVVAGREQVPDTGRLCATVTVPAALVVAA